MGLRKLNEPDVDLDTSLAFIIGRIEEEAMRSGQILSDEQRFLLNHLPNNSALPIWNSADPEWPAVLTTGRCIRKTLRSSRSRAQQRCAAQSGINPRLGVCCRGFETQPTPDVLALALGEHEGAQILVGPLAPHCCCVAGHNRLHSSDPDRGKRSLDSISMDRHRCGMHRDLDSSAICLTTDRGRQLKQVFERCRRSPAWRHTSLNYC
jgi:hypothetical protein